MTMIHVTVDELQPGDVAVLGVPFDAYSSYLRGPAKAPPLIRESLFSESANTWTEGGIRLTATPGWHLLGDLDLPESDAAVARIEKAIGAVLDRGARVISLGGDHSITYPILCAYGRKYSDLTIIQLDAHPDLYDEIDGNRLSHGCPFARIMEKKLAKRLVQVGVRAMTGHQREQAARFGVEVLEMKDVSVVENLVLDGPLYLSLDMDCLDPAFAPGISHWEPGGMSTRDVLKIIHRLDGKLVGADLVEYNPDRDPQGITAMVAAKLLKEILGGMIEERSTTP